MESIKQFYDLTEMEQAHLTEKKVENFINALGDPTFIYPTIASSQFHHTGGDKIRLYMFNHSTEQTLALFGRNGVRDPLFQSMR